MMYADALVSIIILALLLGLFYGPWQAAVTDVARQFVFEQRDAIFDLAVSGKIDFDSDEYRTVRDGLNRLIRFAHELNWTRFALYLLKFTSDGTLEEPSDMKVAIKRIKDENVQKEIAMHVSSAQSMLLGMMALKSIVFFVPSILAILVLWPMGRLTLLIHKGSRFVNLGERMQLEAERVC